MKELYGKKLGMTQYFNEDGTVVPVTVIEAYPMTVVAKKTTDKEGYNAIVVGFGDIKENKVNKPQKGIFTKAGVPVKKYLKEIKVENTDEYEIGSTITLEVLTAGDRVDAHGVSKGKGFAGVIKRYGLHRGPTTHGSNYHRRPGSMGAGTNPGRVFKNKKLAGHMGHVNRTALNLEVVKVDVEKNAVLVKGSIPGAKNSVVNLTSSVK
ncbi:MAG: 50S ribosomal protein L3 [Clostridia bacterium]|nr:50S ribosomal protein L3 [Clostridia bacterium]